MLVPGIISGAQVASGGGSGASVTALELDFYLNPSDWVGLLEIAVYDQSGTNVMPALTGVSGEVTSLSTLSAGQFGTNSTYDTNESSLNEGWPTADFDFSPGSADIHWSSSDSSNGMKVFIKLTAAIEVSLIRVMFKSLHSYALPVLTVKDQDDNVLTPLLTPQDKYDDIWAEHDRYLVGSPSSQAKGLEWVYPEYVETRSISDVVGTAPLIYLSGDSYAGSGTVDNNGTGGTAYDFDLNGISHVSSGDSHFLFDGTNIMKLANSLSAATFLDGLRRTDIADNDISVVGMFRIPTWGAGKILCGTSRGTPQSSEPTIGTSIEMTTGASSAQALGYGMSDDGVHIFHEQSLSMPEDEDFIFGTAERVGTGASSNNEYRGYISNIANGVPPAALHTASRTATNTVSAHSTGVDALSSDEADSFYIGGIQNNLLVNKAVIPNNSRMYEFIVFDEWLTRVQMFDLHKWLERKYRRIIRT